MAQVAVNKNVEVGPGSVPAGIIMIGIGKYYHRTASRCRDVIEVLVNLGHCPVTNGAVASQRGNAFVGFDHRSAAIWIQVTEPTVSFVYTADRVFFVTVDAGRQQLDSAGRAVIIGCTQP